MTDHNRATTRLLFTEREEDVYQILRENPELTNRDLGKQLSLSARRITELITNIRRKIRAARVLIAEVDYEGIF